MVQKDIRSPEELLAMARNSLRSLQDVVFGFGEAQAVIRGLDGEIRYWSRGAARLYGWSSEEAVGRISHDLLRTDFPASLDSINAQLRRDGCWNGELKHTHRDGRSVYVASFWALQPDDAEDTVIEVNNDVTERILANETRVHYAAIIADSDDAIISKTLDGIVTSWNRAAERMFGWPGDEIIGKPIAVIIAPDKMDEEEEILRKLRCGERVDHFDTVRLRRDGKPVLVSITISPIRGPNGDIVGASKIVRDVGHQRQTELALQRARRLQAVGELTGGVAHDFNNLLSVIVGNAELLRPLLDDATEATAMADDILTAAVSGSELTRRLLAFARQQSLKLEVVDLNEYLTSYVALLRRTLSAAITIRSQFPPNLWLTRADASQIGDALINLAWNARDALPAEGGSVLIETANVHLDDLFVADHIGAVAGDYVMLAVTDDGSGMSPDVLDRATEPFFTTKTSGMGNGLGLSMVHGTVAQHGGYLDLTSQPGVGTTVRIYLPRSATQEVECPARNPPAPPMPRGSETILVVDDNAQLRTTVIRSLVALGYRIEEAANGMEALALLEAGAPCDLLFTDVVMPGGLTGYRLADMACQLRPGMKVLMTTGFVRSQSDQDEAGPYQVLRKPYRRQQLALAIRAALDGADPDPKEGEV